MAQDHLQKSDIGIRLGQHKRHRGGIRHGVIRSGSPIAQHAFINPVYTAAGALGQSDPLDNAGQQGIAGAWRRHQQVLQGDAFDKGTRAGQGEPVIVKANMNSTQSGIIRNANRFVLSFSSCSFISCFPIKNPKSSI